MVLQTREGEGGGSKNGSLVSETDPFLCRKHALETLILHPLKDSAKAQAFSAFP